MFFSINHNNVLKCEKVYGVELISGHQAVWVLFSII